MEDKYTMHFDVGDSVIIIGNKNLPDIYKKSSIYWNNDMRQYIHRNAKIVDRDDFAGGYRLDIDGGKHMWLDCLLALGG